MFEKIYLLSPWLLIGLVVTLAIAGAILGFELWRRVPWYVSARKLPYPDGFNDAISGALGALGVFYGVTIGLIAIDVWQRHSSAEETASQEAAAIQTLYLLVQDESSIGAFAPKVGDKDSDIVGRPLGQLTSQYLVAVICDIWREQQDGKARAKGEPKDVAFLRMSRQRLQKFEPETGSEGQRVRYGEAMRALTHLVELRRLRADAGDNQLSGVMWFIILSGAAGSMFVVYLLWLREIWLHRALISVLAGVLGLVLGMIVVNNRPFFGKTSIEPDSYLGIKWIARQWYPALKGANLADMDRDEFCRRTQAGS